MLLLLFSFDLRFGFVGVDRQRLQLAARVALFQIFCLLKHFYFSVFFSFFDIFSIMAN